MNNIKRLQYTLVAEGYAEYAFIPMYINRIAASYSIQAKRSSLGLRPGKSNKSKVHSECENILKDAVNKQHDLFLVGVDLDEVDYEDDQLKHQEEYNKLITSLGTPYQRSKAKVIIYVPIQAIEHWLIYQLYKVESGKVMSANSVEGKDQDYYKKQLYKGRSDGLAMEKIAKAIAENADFEELAKQSRSFCHFHNQVKTFLTSFAA